MKIYISIAWLLFVTGCAAAISDDQDDSLEKQIKNGILLPPHQSEQRLDESDRDLKFILLAPLRAPCNPDKFLADSVPPGYILDPDCPPEIIWPPKLILKGDPGPVIRHGI